MKKQSHCRQLVWWLLFPLMVFCVTLASFARFETLKQQHNDNGGFQWADAQDSLDSCTYEQLEAAFGDENASLASATLPFATEVTASQEQCWSLTDRILRVPRSEILNFDSLIPLGAGCKGGVFMVFLNLSDSQPPCKAVYKTDLVHTNLCADVWTHPWSTSWSHTKSCLAAHFNPFGSSMPGELTGGVIFQAFQQYAEEYPQDPLDTSGIMPTWAMVPMHPEENKNGDHHHHHHTFLRKHHHNRGDYPGVLGMIMPYKKFQSLKPSVARERTAADMAALLHTAAQGLTYVHELGLTHQDLVAKDYKNVGLVQSEDGSLSHSILFDWGYTALDDNNKDNDEEEECSLGKACDFCVESYFPSPRVGGSHGAKHSRRRTLDCENLRTMITTLWTEHVQDAATEGQYWQSQMQAQVDCSRSTQELADFLAIAAQGRTR